MQLLIHLLELMQEQQLRQVREMFLLDIKQDVQPQLAIVVLLLVMERAI